MDSHTAYKNATVRLSTRTCVLHSTDHCQSATSDVAVCAIATQAANTREGGGGGGVSGWEARMLLMRALQLQQGILSARLGSEHKGWSSLLADGSTWKT